MDFIRDLLLNPRFTNYIILVQIPIVFCLFIQCYQAYKLKFRESEFKLLYIAWLINLFFLITNILLKHLFSDFQVRLIIRTWLDLFNIYFFLLVTINSFKNKPLSRLKEIPKIYYIAIFLFAAIFKSIPGSLHIIPYIHLRYVPAALIDFSVLFLLALYFKNISKEYRQKQFLFVATLLYASIQILSIAQRDEFDEKSILYINGIGFALGLIAKFGILVSLSILLLNIIKRYYEKSMIGVQKASQIEKNKLLHKLNFASNILSIKSHIYSSKKLIAEENSILESVLNECLNLLNEKLGYYASYESKIENICILFASKAYQSQIGYCFSVTQGMTGKAIRTGKIQVMNNPSETPEYFSFESIDNKGFKTTIDKDVKSAVAIPVILDNQVLGVYMIESKIENYFTDTDVSILDALVSQGLTAIKNIRLLQEIELGKTVLDSLKEIDKSLVLVGKSMELSNILKIILKQSLELAKGDLGSIAFKTKDNKLQVVESSDSENIGRPADINRRLDINDSISGLAVLEKRTIYIPDITKASDRYKKLYKNYTGEKLTCELVVPLKVLDEVIGVFNTESKTADKFTPSDIEKVEGFAGQAAIAIHIFKLFEEIKKHRNRLDALAEIDLLILSSNQSLTETLDTLLRKGLQLIEKKHGEILLFETDQHGEQKLINKKSSFSTDEGFPFSLDSICGLAIEKRKIVYLPFVNKDESSQNIIDESIYIPNSQERLLYRKSTWGEMKCELVLPLIIKDSVIGVFNFESEEYDDFKEDEVSLLRNLSFAAAIAIHNAQLFEDINKINIALSNSVDKKNIAMIIDLGTLINHRIGNEVGSIRTSLIDELLSGDFGEPDEDLKTVYMEMLNCAQLAIDASEEVGEEIEKLLKSLFTPMDFHEMQLLILRNKNSYSGKINLSISGFENMSSSLGNQRLLKEILSEIISNAIKSVKEDGQVVITGKTDLDQNTITIKDNGCGIKKENIKMIWEKEWSYWEQSSKGGGIGLYEVKLIIEAWGGKISVKSKENVGTTFIIKLPVVKN